MNNEEVKKLIQSKFKTVTNFANIIGAPIQTVFAWTRKKHTNTPASWSLSAYIDAATYRSKRVAGWQCRGCGCVVEAINEAKRPPCCGACGGRNFSPVSVIHESE